MKKIAKLFVFLILMICIMPQTGCSSFTFTKESQGLEFVLNEDEKSYGVVGIGTCKDLDIIIPSKYNQLPVSSVENYAFEKCKDITSVFVPKSIKTIKSRVFYGCYSIKKITLPFLDKPFGSFFGISSIPTNHDNYITDLKEVIITGGDSLPRNAFIGFDTITTIILPDSITNIGDSAFSGCSSLKTIVLPKNITSIGKSAFSGCTSLDCNEYMDCLYLGSRKNPYIALIKTNNIDASEITINKNTKVIVSHAFRKCVFLKSISIPNGIFDIGCSAFYECKSLISIVIPNNVTYIHGDTFYNCSSLETIVLSDKIKAIEERAFEGCVSLKSISLPETVVTIGERAFYNCNTLESVVMSENITTIGEFAFYNCNSLESIVMSENITTIGEYAFFCCNSLKEFKMPSKITNIGAHAFRNCSYLKKIVIPETVTKIGSSAFELCRLLTIYCELSSQPSEWSAYWNYSNRPVYWKGEWGYKDGEPKANKYL